MAVVMTSLREFLELVGIVLGTLYLLAMLRFRFVAPRRLKRWADENGYQVIASKQPWLIREPTPFTQSGSPNQTIYRLTVRTPDGKNREAWARVGDAFWPSVTVWLCPIEVRWIDETDDMS